MGEEKQTGALIVSRTRVVQHYHEGLPPETAIHNTRRVSKDVG